MGVFVDELVHYIQGLPELTLPMKFYRFLGRVFPNPGQLSSGVSLFVLIS